MFNFIFDGKIGDILAPVVPTNRLFLAIQHHKNEEVHQLMLNNDIQRNADGGYAAIHVACRYNNRFALEMIISKGVPVESVDQAGNTPLHYASKYGHLELCKYLIELGASAGRKNSSQQTPYDVAAEHHTVRQYLLPLQFQAERNAGEGSGDSYGAPQMSQPMDNYHNQPNHNYNYGQPAAPAAVPGIYNGNAVPPPHAYAPPPAYFGNAAPPPALNDVHAAPAMHNPSPPPGPPGVATFGPPPSNMSSTPAAPTQVYNNARPTATTTRIIQPDGFHSSASDPALQKKYGHIQLTNNIAPPPTTPFQPSAVPAGGPYGIYGPPGPTGPGAPGSVPSSAPPPMMGGPGPAPAGIYSRYVPYDAHTNSAAPVPAYPPAQASAPAPAPSHFALPSFPSSRQATLPTYTQQAPPARTPTAAANTMSSMAVPQNSSRSGSTDGTSPTSVPVTPAPGSARLLGNKGLSGGGDDLFRGGLASPSGDVDIITANSSSSSVM